MLFCCYIGISGDIAVSIHVSNQLVMTSVADIFIILLLFAKLIWAEIALISSIIGPPPTQESEKFKYC